MNQVRVTPADISLFHVALRYLSDATQWVRIAQMNGLTDPIISAALTLNLPPVDPGAGGGIPATATAGDGSS